MEQPNISTIANQYDWEKRWMERNNLLTASLTGEQYHYAHKKKWGVSFDHSFFLYREGIVTCYQLISENTTYGSHIAHELERNPSLADEWCEELMRKTSAVLTYLSAPSENVLKKASYEAFVRLFDAYLAILIAIIRVPNYLPKTLLDTTLVILQRARAETETAYAQVDTFLSSSLITLAHKENRDPTLMQLLYADEAGTYFKNESLPTDAELSKRSPLSGLYFENGKCTVVNGEEAVLFEKLVAEKSAPASGIVNGSTAVKGIVQGTTRIVYDPQKIDNFQTGDILITSMTNPEFVPLMKKAGAIVTDGGGILCHAAIVARELGKPCVINTQVATTTFKDGDRVEVDATAGTIRKI